MSAMQPRYTDESLTMNMNYACRSLARTRNPKNPDHKYFAVPPIGDVDALGELRREEGTKEKRRELKMGEEERTEKKRIWEQESKDN
jgi:hypothetical protein